MEQDMPVIVFKLNEDDNFMKVAQGDNIGTKIS